MPHHRKRPRHGRGDSGRRVRQDDPGRRACRQLPGRWLERDRRRSDWPGSPATARDRRHPRRHDAHAAASTRTARWLPNPNRAGAGRGRHGAHPLDRQAVQRSRTSGCEGDRRRRSWAARLGRGWRLAGRDHRQQPPALRQAIRQHDPDERAALQALRDGDAEAYIAHKQDEITVHDASCRRSRT